MKALILLFSLFISLTSFSQQEVLRQKMLATANKLELKIVGWRRDLHEHPELGNNEVRTSAIVAKHLESLGMEVRTGVAKTGVVAVLKGGKPGPVIALRADMDALPVTERNDLPFASKVKTVYNGVETGLMHACGHDAHVAILMGVAEVLASVKKDLPGTVKFIFQPAEEGVPVGEVGGARQMIREGVLENPAVDVIFGMHSDPKLESGKISFRPGPAMAAVNNIRIVIKGKGAHGANPWYSIDPIVVSAQVINNIQTIVSRNLNLTRNPGVVTIGLINGGTRWNIIPEEVLMMGTIRAFTEQDKQMMVDRLKQIISNTAEANGATADIQVPYTTDYPAVINDTALTEKMSTFLKKALGDNNVIPAYPETAAEDFAFFQQKVPGLFLFFGIMKKGEDPKNVAARHTPEFYLDESGMKTGVKTFLTLVLDYMYMKR
jgi:amidohydrolase